MNARQAAQLARQALLREDPYPEVGRILTHIEDLACLGKTSREFRVPTTKRLAIIGELHARGFQAWVSIFEEGRPSTWITVRWPIEEEV